MAGFCFFTPRQTAPGLAVRCSASYFRAVLLLYRLFLWSYRAAIAITALWNEKARLWQQGRSRQWERLRAIVPPAQPGQRRYWVHCASLGEFEQGRPVIEALKARDAGCVVVLSFFSPSGYGQRKDYEGADAVVYLPMDGPRNAARFLNILQPTQALFVKYEFWHFYLKTLEARHIPSMLISGAFRAEQPFFQWWGGFFRKMLQRFSLLSVQDEGSLALLQSIGLGAKAQLTGDTRYDRVAAIAATAKDLPLIAAFKGKAKLLVAGSTWPEEERMLRAFLPQMPEGWKLVLAPHEIHAAHLEAIKAVFGEDCVFYSALTSGASEKVLVIDNIGMLSSLYRYGEIACVGGGFNRGGIHNVLEPAVFGLPVVMGPGYQKFPEAVMLAEQGLAFPVNDEAAFFRQLAALMADEGLRERLCAAMRAQVMQRTGATAKILALLPAAL
jgi:3-deoxy-D-manno-octulosonic-acid transferase